MPEYGMPVPRALGKSELACASARECAVGKRVGSPPLSLLQRLQALSLSPRVCEEADENSTLKLQKAVEGWRKF